MRDLIKSLHSDASPTAQRLKGYSHDYPLPDLVTLDASDGAPAAGEPDRGTRRDSLRSNGAVARSLPSLNASRPDTQQQQTRAAAADLPTPRSVADGDGSARRAPVDVQVALRYARHPAFCRALNELQ